MLLRHVTINAFAYYSLSPPGICHKFVHCPPSCLLVYLLVSGGIWFAQRSALTPICFVRRRPDPPCHFSATNNNGDQKILAVRKCFFIEKAQQKQERVCKGGFGSMPRGFVINLVINMSQFILVIHLLTLNSPNLSAAETSLTGVFGREGTEHKG